MKSATDLGGGAKLLSHHVDWLELSCTLPQVKLLAPDGDPLDDRLAAFKFQCTGRSGQDSLPTAWKWSGHEGGEVEIVRYLRQAKRRGRPYTLECSAWIIFVARPFSAIPRFVVQTRADYLQAIGPIAAYRQIRDWATENLIPLVGGIDPDAEASWRIARIDLAADISGVGFEIEDLRRFTSRSRVRGIHDDDGSGIDW